MEREALVPGACARRAVVVANEALAGQRVEVVEVGAIGGRRDALHHHAPEPLEHLDGLGEVVARVEPAVVSHGDAARRAEAR
jgi:hypothetical protein